MKDLDRKFSGAIDQLVQSYDEHMKKIMPKPKLLPIRVNLVIASKNNMRIETAHVKPFENVQDVFKIVEEYQVARGDPVLAWVKEGIKVRINGPLSMEEEKNDHVEMAEGDEKGALTQSVVVEDWNLPFSTYSLVAGSTLTLLGDNIVTFNSDKPLECMTLCYDKDPNATFNYFSCKTCGSNCMDFKNDIFRDMREL